MSAIFGILHFDGSAVSTRALERMSNTLRHRGPDGRKFIVAGGAGIGHCLMRVNQEDVFEAQPIRDSATGVILAADCRIDNREELADRFGIPTAALRTMPDSAFILRAYQGWGEDCAAHLIGDFAFAVWDAGAGKLVLGRDHMGQRNLFYHRGENFLVFASEIKALWALADVPHRLLDEAIAGFFQRTRERRPAGATLYAGISAVPGGSLVVVGQDRDISSRRYWTPHGDPSHASGDEGYYVEQYRSVLAEAVACRLRRLTAPGALLLSAGFDSAAIAGLAGPVVAAQGRKLVGLSWLGEESTLTTRGDIRPWVTACRRVMPHLDSRELSRPYQDPLAGLEQLFLMHDGPGPGSRKTSGFLFAEAAAAGARLVMDGYGGDYTINPRGYGALARHLRRGELRRFIAELRAYWRDGKSLWRIFKHDIVLMLLPLAVIRWQRLLRGVGNSAIILPALRQLEGPYLKQLRQRNAGAAQRVDGWISPASMREWSRRTAADVCRSPAAAGAIPAAAHGLELTRPFHDKRVVELGLAIPEALYVKNGLNRHLARRALADMYPPEFQSRGRDHVGALGDSAIVDLTAPAVLAEAERLAGDEKFSSYFDFGRLRRVLAKPATTPVARAARSAAVRALLTARFIEWFSGSNA